MDSDSHASRGLPSVGASIRHHLVAVFATTLLVAGLAGAYLASLSTTYTSAATVLLSPAPGNPLTAESASGSTIQLTVAMQTEAELVRTPAIRDVVAEALGRPAPDIGETLSVEVPPNTQMLEITFTSTSPTMSAEGAQAFADGYLEYRAERAMQSQQARVETLAQQIEETDESLRRASAEAAEGGAASYASREVDLLVDRIARLSNSLSSAESVSTAPGSVINPAPVPEDADGFPHELVLIGGVLGGLVMGTLIAVLLEWRRDLIRANDEAEELGVSVFATIKPSFETELAAVAGEGVHEAYRRLRAGVIANGPRPHVLAVAGLDREYSSAVATNLALALAEAEFSVLLVSADPQSSQVEDILSIDQRPGLSEVVRGMVAPGEVVFENRGLRVLSSGVDLVSTRDLSAGPAFRSMVADFRSEYDYVVLASATTGSADGDAVISAADSVLLVLRSDRTTKGRLLAALERFEHLGIAPLGAAKVVAARASGSRNMRKEKSPTATEQSDGTTKVDVHGRA